jgi:hypothetical protein
MKVDELAGAQLDYWAALADGRSADEIVIVERADGSKGLQGYDSDRGMYVGLNYSTDWRYGGPIIEKNDIKIMPWHPGRKTGINFWMAQAVGKGAVLGSTALLAAMRAFVASKYGKTVPDE